MSGSHHGLFSDDGTAGKEALRRSSAAFRRGLGEGTPPPPEPADFRKRYNQAPTEKAPVVRIKNGRRELLMLRWWLAEDEKRNEWINVRSEDIATSGA